MTNSTLERLTSEEERVRAERDVRQARQNRVILIAILVLLAAIYVIGIVRDITGAFVTITNIQVIGPTSLCPGDSLLYRYDYSARGEGTLRAIATVWRIDPPQTIVFSQSREFVLIGDRQETIAESWSVPGGYLNLATGEVEPLPAGNYERQLAITSPNDSDVGDTGIVKFSIRADCPQEG